MKRFNVERQIPSQVQHDHPGIAYYFQLAQRRYSYFSHERRLLELY